MAAKSMALESGGWVWGPDLQLWDIMQVPWPLSDSVSLSVHGDNCSPSSRGRASEELVPSGQGQSRAASAPPRWPAAPQRPLKTLVHRTESLRSTDQHLHDPD